MDGHGSVGSQAASMAVHLIGQARGFSRTLEIEPCDLIAQEQTIEVVGV